MKLSEQMQNWDRHNRPSDAQSYVGEVQALEKRAEAAERKVERLDNMRRLLRYILETGNIDHMSIEYRDEVREAIDAAMQEKRLDEGTVKQ